MMIDLSEPGSTYSTRFPVRVSSRPLWRNYRGLVAFDLVRLEGEDQLCARWKCGVSTICRPLSL
jgi:hypothetical protein